MKKIIASILAVLYLSASMGTTVHLHYCMDKLVGWSLLDHNSRDCSSCGMPKLRSGPEEGCMVKMKGCCHDEHKQFKSEKDQASQLFFAFTKLTPVIAGLSYIGQGPLINTISVDQPAINGPPLLCHIPLFLRNCNFRI
jgi:hypothetical protein